ncbi:MAG: M1 family metallopeptidase [Planctomycetes bacterium]|nr:M1 family metallopeptidase [Planctomycetota bacterium]
MPRAPRAILPSLLLVAACASVPEPRVATATPFPEPAPLVPRRRAIDVEHYALELALHPAERRLEGRARVRFWPIAGAAAIEYVELDLDGLEVRSVKDRAGRALVFRQSEGVLGITLAEPLAAGEFQELAIDYGGTPVRGLWFADDEQGVPTQVFTQGECEDARGWFPCVDDPSDRATFELAVDVPRAWTTLSAGVRTERVERGERAMERWRMDFPHPPYLDTLVAGEFVAKERAWEGTPLVFLADPRFEADIEPCFAATTDVLALFSRLTGVRYPYVKYAQACVAEFPFGGMENVSATTLTDTALGDERARRDAPMDGLIAHEAAHQWFGDLMTCADWSQVWLNEGFATYFGALWTEHARGEDEYAVAVRRAQDAYVAGDAKAARAIVADVARRPMDLFFTGHVYPGGAARLHQLRCLLGDDAFFRGVALYAGRNQGRSVVTDDLRAAMEAASGRALAEEFRAWFETAGHAELRVKWRHDGARVVLDVEQLQDAPATVRARVAVELDFGGERHVETVELARRAQTFEFACTRAPRWVLFDARGALPKRCEDVKTGEEWIALLEHSDRAPFRLDALAALSKAVPEARGDERARLWTAIRRAAREEACASVREAAVPVLATFRDAAARAELLAIAATDERSGARCAALAALKPNGPDAELARFADEQYAAGWSWNTMAHAAALLVAARPAGAFLWLQTERA